MIPTVFVDPSTGTSVLVQETLDAVLDADLVERIKDVSIGYNMMDDTIDLTFERRVDGMRARFKIPRSKLLVASPLICAAAFQSEADQLAKLILFLA